MIGNKRIKSFDEILDVLESMYPDIISGKSAVNNKCSFGSTNPKLVARAIRKEKRRMKDKKARL